MENSTSNRRHLLEDMSPILFGTVLGLGLYIVYEYLDNVEPSIYMALLAFIWVAPIVAMFVVEARRLVKDVLIACAVGLSLSSLSYLFVRDVGEAESARAIFVVLIVVGAGATTFIQSIRQDRRVMLPMPSWQQSAWDNVLTILLSLLFVGAGWLVLFLWAALFKLINIEFFDDLFTDTEWFAYVFGGTMFGAGVWLARGRPQIVQAVGRLFGVLFRTLTPVLALVSLMFLVTLPFVGLQPLWDTKSATGILLSLVFALALGVAGAALVRERKTKVSAFENWVIRAGLLALPILTFLAAMALWLRINQYGLTPERLYGGAIVVFAGIISVVGLLSALALGRDWLVTIDRFMPAIAAVTMTIAVILHLPPYEVFGWSTNNQLSRLENGAVSPRDFDFGMLKFRLGDQGREALVKLEADKRLSNDPEVSKVLAALKEADNYRSWRNGRTSVTKPGVDRNDPATYLSIRPEGRPIPPGLKAAIQLESDTPVKICGNEITTRNQVCKLQFIDLNDDGLEDAYVWLYGSVLWTYLQADDESWSVGPRLALADHSLDSQDLKTAQTSEEIEVAEPLTKSVIIGGVRFE